MKNLRFLVPLCFAMFSSCCLYSAEKASAETVESLFDGPFAFSPPYSVSLTKPAGKNYVALFVNSAGRVWLKVEGNEDDPLGNTAAVRRQMIRNAVENYNYRHPHAPLAVDEKTVERFVDAPFVCSSVADIVRSGSVKGDGIAPAEYVEILGEWLRAAFRTTEAMGHRLRVGSGVIVCASGDLAFSKIRPLFLALARSRFFQVSLLTRVMGYYVDSYDVEPDVDNRYGYRLTSITLPYADVMCETSYDSPSALYMPVARIDIYDDNACRVVDETESDAVMADDDSAFGELEEEEDVEEEGIDAPDEYVMDGYIPESRAVKVKAGGNFNAGNAYALFSGLRGSRSDKVSLFGGQRSMCRLLTEKNLPVYRSIRSLYEDFHKGRLTERQLEEQKRRIAKTDSEIHPVMILSMAPDATYSTFVAALNAMVCAEIYDYRLDIGE